MRTDSSLCVGCNKCIFKCPTHANDAVLENGDNKIHVNNTLCIYCGECLDVCDHQARILEDDTQRFFADLKAGRKIAIVAAPAIRHNIPKYEQLFAYLQTLGATVFYDVGFGADITTWGYIKAAREQGLASMIAQPCPVVVSYIESFQPELIPALAPVHSPVLCTAIYMKKYMGISEDIAFLSPCIGKAVEFADPNTGGYVSYNVTYRNILEYLETQEIDLDQYTPKPFDSMKGGIGMTFSRPGGLTENVRFYLGDETWIYQIEGIHNLKPYLAEYAKRIREGRPVPFLVDALNCVNGCNMGTATLGNLAADDINYHTDRMKRAIDKQDAEKLMKHFESTLRLEDFLRSYTNKSHSVPKAEPGDVERVFAELDKKTDRERRVNCFACGYGSCTDFAGAVALGQNHKENCFQYSRKLIAEQTSALEIQHNMIVSSIQYASKIQGNLLPRKAKFEEAFTDHAIIWNPRDVVGGDVYWLRNFEKGSLLCVCDCTGHGTPGALLTMLVSSAFETIVTEENCDDPALIMAELDNRLATSLNAEERRSEKRKRLSVDFNDGCDLAILFISKTDKRIKMASGNTNIFVCNGSEVVRFTGQRLHIGSGYLADKGDVAIQEIPYREGNKYYISSDGLYDQIGEDGTKFGYRTLRDIVLALHNRPQGEIVERVWQIFEEKRGSECRRDDVELIAFQL